MLSHLFQCVFIISHCQFVYFKNLYGAYILPSLKANLLEARKLCNEYIANYSF